MASRKLAGADPVRDAIDYAGAIAELRQPASNHARSACARFLSDLDAARHKGSQWEFRPALAQRAI